MHFRQFYLSCLAQASYLVGSEGEAAVVDPRRDVEEYLAEAKAHGLTIRYVIETHLHADFVSGHRELAQRTGAQIVISKRAKARFPHLGVEDGDRLQVGSVTIEVMETPGHTPEGISLLVSQPDSPDAPRRVLTGDTLFVGDVGRPDLVGAKGFTAREMATALYQSLHDRLLKLPDSVEVWPAHGAGSLCGKNLSQDTSSTIGRERATNLSLQPMSLDDFVQRVTTDLPEVPRYFPLDVELNRQGASLLVARSALERLSPEAFEARARETSAQILDVRSSAEFAAGHLPEAVNVGLGGQFAAWSGALLDAERPVLIVAPDDASADEARLRLARVGLEQVDASLSGGMAAWTASGRSVASHRQWTVAELRANLGKPGLRVLDVRRSGEYESGHVPGAVLVPLDRLEAELAKEAGLLPATEVAVICAGGYRSSAACSLLARAGIGPLVDVLGGTSAWVAAGYATEGSAPACDAARN